MVRGVSNTLSLLYLPFYISQPTSTSSFCQNIVYTLCFPFQKRKILELSGVAVVVALKLQHGIVIRGGHHVDELGGREQRRIEQVGDVMGVTFAQAHCALDNDPLALHH